MTAALRSLDIGVCTFRRASLEDTLRSLATLELPRDTRVRIVVADNDDGPSARPLVERVAADHPLPVSYIHAPARNISLARNACLDACSADLLAFIDDDETATPRWLGALLAVMDRLGADAVLGQVRATYAPGTPDWMKRGDFHSTQPVFVSGRIRTGYTCNVLMRMAAPSIAGRRFRLELGRTGGEDTAFFLEVWKAGGRIEYAPDAVVEEAVTDARASFAWLAKRRFRMGQTHGRLIATESDGLRRVAQAALASAKLGYCGLQALAGVASPVGRRRGILRGTLHAGVVAGLMGVRELQHYGGPSGESGGSNRPKGRRDGGSEMNTRMEKEEW